MSLRKDQVRPRLRKAEYEAFLNFRDRRNVLVIGDLHAPFVIDGYLEHCINIKSKYNCDTVVFIGDIIDNHYASYHESDPDGFGGAEELERAQQQVALFHDAFPNSKVCLGNHDLLPNRKAFSSGVSERWVKPIGDVLNTPTWEYAETFIIDGVLYTHGTGTKARPRALDEEMSVVQGHYHGESYVYTFVQHDRTFFAMQIGCGVNRDSYAMAYAKAFKKPFLNVGVVLNSGRCGIIEPML